MPDHAVSTPLMLYAMLADAYLTTDANITPSRHAADAADWFPVISFAVI